MIVAVIPARGGSKRIPRKNVRSFAGKPIIAYSIEAALATGLFDSVVVSTEDLEIAECARRFGAQVPFMRPANLADEYTGTNAVVKQAIEWLNVNVAEVEYACCIYATAPFVQPRYLREGFERLRGSDHAFAFSVTTYPFPIQRALRIKSQDGVEPYFPQWIGSRSQDLEESYHDAGQFYWGRARSFLDEVPLFAAHSAPIVLPRHLVQDIDTPEDWRRAELMFRAITFEAGS